jgi:hypothetical protein
MGDRPRRLDDFTGDWQMQRDILHADGSCARFEGTARFEAAGDGLVYREEGMLLMPGQPAIKAERRYRWGSDLSVFFDDGRFFHRIPPEGGETGHWCDPDIYRGHYDFSSWPVFSVSWQVTGPRKDYQSVTTYRR